MNNKPQKLELTWIGKDEQPRLEPRILLEDAGKLYHVPHRMTENNIFDNQLIFGGNLLSLTALEAQRNKKRRLLQSLFAFRWSLQ